MVGMLAVVTVSVTSRGSRRLGMGLCTLFLQEVDLYIQLLNFFLIGILLDEGACDVEEPVHDHHGVVVGVSTVDAELGDEPVPATPERSLSSLASMVAVMCLLLPEGKGELRALLGGRGGRVIEVPTWATVLSRK